MRGRLRGPVVLLAVAALTGPPAVASTSSAGAPATTATHHELLTLTAKGEPTKARSITAHLTADGALLTFVSQAGSLLEGERIRGGHFQAYVRSRDTGTTTLLSRTVSGRAAKADSWDARVSADGHFAVFESDAWHLAPRDGRDLITGVYLRDLETGTTTEVARGRKGKKANGNSGHPDVSADGNLVVYASRAGNLVAGDSNRTSDIFLLDRTTGVTTRISDSAEDERRRYSLAPTISADGRTVVFESKARDLVPDDTNSHKDVFAYDTATGETTLVSRAVNGTPGNDDSVEPDVSPDGDFVTFASYATDLAPGVPSYRSIYLRDLSTGVTTLISRAADGGATQGVNVTPEVSNGGATVTFMSYAANLVPGDDNNAPDVFVVDVAAGVTIRASQQDGPYSDRKQSLYPSITADGHEVAFATAKRLVGADQNRDDDIYLWADD